MVLSMGSSLHQHWDLAACTGSFYWGDLPQHQHLTGEPPAAPGTGLQHPPRRRPCPQDGLFAPPPVPAGPSALHPAGFGAAAELGTLPLAPRRVSAWFLCAPLPAGLGCFLLTRSLSPAGLLRGRGGRGRVCTRERKSLLRCRMSNSSTPNPTGCADFLISGKSATST